MNKQIIRMVSVAVTASICSCLSLSVEAKSGAKDSAVAGDGVQTQTAPRGSCHEIIVNAMPETVYNAIIKMRDDSQDTVKELSREGNHCILEERFPGLPLVGEAKCVYKEVYTPCSRIEYSMVHSDKFKAFEGRWLILPTDDGAATKLSLSSYIDIDLPMPFAKQLCKMQTNHGVKERLQDVKSACEKKQVARSLSKSLTQ